MSAALPMTLAGLVVLALCATYPSAPAHHARVHCFCASTSAPASSARACLICPRALGAVAASRPPRGRDGAPVSPEGADAER